MFLFFVFLQRPVAYKSDSYIKKNKKYNLTTLHYSTTRQTNAVMVSLQRKKK